MRKPAPPGASVPPESWADRGCLGSDLVLWHGPPPAELGTGPCGPEAA